MFFIGVTHATVPIHSCNSASSFVATGPRHRWQFEAQPTHSCVQASNANF
jgi:hypothetical protein